MKSSLLILTLVFSMSACQTMSAKIDNQVGIRTTVSFIDLEGFDADLALALRSSAAPITVEFLEKPSPNDTPARLQKWVSQVRENAVK